MMNVSNVTSTPAAFRTIQAAPTVSDTKTQKLQSQITNAQQRLNHVSFDSHISAQEKAKERREIQQQLAELNRKLQLLRQKQEAEERKAEQKEARKLEEKQIFTEEMFENQKPSADNDKNPVAATQKQADLEDIALSSINMQKIYSAEANVQQSDVQNNVSHRKEGRMNVLEAEIKSDELYGSVPHNKREALSQMRNEATFTVEEIGQPKHSEPLNSQAFGKIIITE